MYSRKFSNLIPASHLIPASLLCTGAIVLGAATQAQAQQCGPARVNIGVEIRCEATLMGMSTPAKKLPVATSAQSRLTDPLSPKARMRFGEYTILAELMCSTGQSRERETFATFGFDVRLTKDGRPYASPIHLAMINNLMLDQRQGRKPLTVSSYYFFEKPAMIDGAPYTRLDYTCVIDVPTP